MGTIVVGYDGTEGAEVALAHAAGLAKDLGCALHVVFSHSAGTLPVEAGDLVDVIRERADQLLAQAREHVQGVEVTTSFRRHDPAPALIEAANELGARYIVVGSYGERPLKSALVGSTPTKLLHLAEQPVVVVRAPE